MKHAHAAAASPSLCPLVKLPAARCCLQCIECTTSSCTSCAPPLVCVSKPACIQTTTPGKSGSHPRMPLPPLRTRPHTYSTHMHLHNNSQTARKTVTPGDGPQGQSIRRGREIKDTPQLHTHTVSCMGRVAAHAYKHLQAGQPPHHLGWLPPKLHKRSPENLETPRQQHTHTYTRTRMRQPLPESRLV
jgi:hypothetical protein